MDLYPIDVKKYKVVFFPIQVFNILAIISSYLLVDNGVYIFHGLNYGRGLTMPVLFVMVVLALWHSQYQRNELRKILTFSDFDERLAGYERYYRFQMFWFFFSCLISCFLCILTNRFLFLCFACFDVFVSLQLFPTLRRFRRDLQNDEIFFS